MIEYLKSKVASLIDLLYSSQCQCQEHLFSAHSCEVCESIIDLSAHNGLNGFLLLFVLSNYLR